MRNYLRLLPIAAFFVTLGAMASETATVSFSEDPSRIDGLKIPVGASVPVVEYPVPGSAGYAAVLEGNFVRQYWSLLLGKAVLAQDSEGNFVAKIPITGDITAATFFAVGPLGEIERETVLVTTDILKSSRDENGKLVSSNLPQMNVGIGLTSNAYHDTTLGGTSYNALDITAKFGLTQKFEDSNFALGFTAFYNVIPITQSGNTTARFLGINGRVGYTFPQITDPWRLTVYVGWYFLTMFDATDDPAKNGFGFQNANGPELYPVVTRALPGNATISAYFKFAPVSNGFSFFSQEGREIAGGIVYAYPLSNGHPFGYSLDISSLKLVLPPPPEVDSFYSSTVSIGVSYGL